MPYRQVKVAFEADGLSTLRRLAVRDGTSEGAVVRRKVRAYLRAWSPNGPSLIATFLRAAHQPCDGDFRVWFSRRECDQLSKIAEHEQATVTCCVRAIVWLSILPLPIEDPKQAEKRGQSADG